MELIVAGIASRSHDRSIESHKQNHMASEIARRFFNSKQAFQGTGIASRSHSRSIETHKQNHMASEIARRFF